MGENVGKKGEKIKTMEKFRGHKHLRMDFRRIFQSITFHQFGQNSRNLKTFLLAKIPSANFLKFTEKSIGGVFLSKVADSKPGSPPINIDSLQGLFL